MIAAYCSAFLFPANIFFGSFASRNSGKLKLVYMKNPLSARFIFRLQAGFILVLILLFSCASETSSSGMPQEAPELKNRHLLLMADTNQDLIPLREKLENEGWKIRLMTQEDYLGAEDYIELSNYGTLIAYIHKPLNQVTEEALISYAESGGKLLVLHHSLASAKTANPEWLKFLGVSIQTESDSYPWKVTAETCHTMVNLAPGHYITSHGITYDRKVDFHFSERPDLEGEYPAFDLPDTEVFHNQRLSGDDEKVVLFGYKVTDELNSAALQLKGLPTMEPTSGWYKPAGKGWVIYLQAGHSADDYRNPNFYQVILNCLNWQANDPVFASAAFRPPAFKTLDLDLHEPREVILSDGTEVSVQVENIKHKYDSCRKAVRGAEVKIRINNHYTVLDSGMYNLPRRVAGIQVDCPVTSALVHYRDGVLFNPWALDKDVRLRLWPGDSPWIVPDTFKYPVEAAWFSSDTQMTNDPTYVDHGDLPGNPESGIYYHHGLDVGGSEGQNEVYSAVDGLVLSSADLTLSDYRKNTPVRPRYDVIYLLDERGWIYRNSHLYSIDPGVKTGRRVKKGQFLGLLGKEGASGGWSHFHFDVSTRQPSGKFGSEDAYPFYWQSYFADHASKLKAVARPHKLIKTGEEVLLDGSMSRCFSGDDSGLRYKWIFSNGTESDSMVAYKRYGRPGFYSEILQVTDQIGNSDYDFCPVLVTAPGKPLSEQPHTIHAAFYPSLGLSPGQEITFKVRSFGINPLEGKEIWDFGDGSPRVAVCSDGNANVHNPEGYAVTRHAFQAPGCYLVSVSRTSGLGYTATARLQVVVGE